MCHISWPGVQDAQTKNVRPLSTLRQGSPWRPLVAPGPTLHRSRFFVISASAGGGSKNWGRSPSRPRSELGGLKGDGQGRAPNIFLGRQLS